MTSNNAKTIEYEFPRKREQETFLQLIYNPKEGTILGRNAKNWSQLLLFYAIFYIILAALFAICMQGLLSTLSESEPKWKLEESLIGTNPGLGFRPLPEETERGAIIQFDTKKPEEGKYWKELLDKFLKPYNDRVKEPSGGQKICSFNDTGATGSRVCAVPMDAFGNCSSANEYGYNKGRPCVFLKLNKIFNWVPEYYDDVSDLPKEMPADLKEYINGLPPTDRKQVWVSCGGLLPNDKERVGQIKYYPSRGFPAYNYPYTNQQGYLSPLVAVQFETPKLNEFVSVECIAWAKNVQYSGSLRDRQGSVTFQLFID